MVEIPHLQSMLHGRYIGFIDNLSSTIKPHLQKLFNLCKSDQSSNTGQNITYLLKLYEISDLNTLISKKHIVKSNRVNPISEDEKWKLEMIKEICKSKMGFLETDVEKNDLETMLEIICTE